MITTTVCAGLGGMAAGEAAVPGDDVDGGTALVAAGVAEPPTKVPAPAGLQPATAARAAASTIRRSRNRGTARTLSATRGAPAAGSGASPARLTSASIHRAAQEPGSAERVSRSSP